jgi:glycosyltransferase involved in cell wall biosynthesis
MSRSKEARPKLSVIIPAYNEEATIADVISCVRKVDVGMEKEIIVVDDGSVDRTARIAAGAGGIKLIRQKRNQGKGAAVITGMKASTGSIIIIQDADSEYDPRHYPRLLKPIKDGRTDVVYGSRLLGKHMDMYGIHRVGNAFLTSATNALFGAKLTDMETCYKVFRREALNGIRLRSRRFDFEPEITAKFLKNGHGILEVPIDFRPRSFEQGKKITWKDGVKALFYLIKYRLSD